MKTRFAAMLALMIVLWFPQGYAVMEKVRLEQLTSRSHTIVIARVVDVHSDFADVDRKDIVTYVTIAPTDVLKGTSGSSLVLTIPGGVVGDIGLWVEDTPHFHVGEEVLLFVNDDYKGRKTVSEWHQGKFSVVNGATFVDGFEVIIQDFSSGIRAFISRGETGKIQLERRKPTPRKSGDPGMGPEAVPSISYITPSSSPAIRPYAINPNDPFNPGDRGTTIDVYGSGFGATQGTSVVRFYENTANPPVIADAEDYLLWSDTRITCKVPGRQFTTTFLNASSGPLYVVTSGGTSNGVQFTVSFAAPSKRFPSMPVTYYINENGTPDADSEFQAVQDAFQTWENVSNSILDYTYGGTTSRIATPFVSDFNNDCLWIESSWPFPSSAIGVNVYYFDGLPSSTVILEFDIFFNGVDFLWSTTGDPSRRDVQNLATHESGHSLNLQDIYGSADAAKTMYGYGSAGETSKRTLELDDIAGCTYIYPDPYTLSLSSAFEFDGSAGGQLNVSNISQGTNVISYSTPLSRTIYYGTTYQLDAPIQQTINSRDYRFSRWSDGVVASTRQINPTGNITLTAEYKMHFASSTTSAISNSNQRKIIRAWNGYYFACYESGGHIWLTRSTDNGATWSPEKRMSDDVSGFTNRAPSVSMSYLSPSEVLVAWEAFGYTGNYVNRVYVRAIDPVVFATVVHKNLITVQSSYPFSAMPVLAPTFALTTSPSLLAWYDPAGPYIKGYIVDYGIYGTLYQGSATSLTIAPNEVSSPLWLDPTWTLAWANGSTLYSMTAYRTSINGYFQLVAFPPQVVTDYGGGISDLSMISIDHHLAICWIDNGVASGPISSSYAVRFREESSGGWNTPITVWPDVYSGVSSPSLTYNNASNTVSVMWQGGSSIRHAQRTGSSWSSVSTVVAGETPSVSVGTPGNTGGMSEILLSRGGTSAPFAVQRTSITYGGGEEGDRLVADGKESDSRFDPREDSTVVQGRGGYIQFPAGSMHIAVLAASINGRALRYGALSDSLHVARTRQLDSAATTLAYPGVGMLELTVLYRAFGAVPSSAQFALEVRDASSGALLQKLRSFRNSEDTVVTLRLPLNYPGRSVTIGLAALNMNAPKRFVVERWIVPQETGNARVSNLQKEGESTELPASFALHQNYPNPFNPSTTINFDLPENGNVSLVVYDVLGREVATLVNGELNAGRHEAVFDASSLASGIYMYKLQAGAQTEVKRMLLLK